MARTKKIDAGKTGEFRHGTSVGESGEILYDVPIVIEGKEDMRNYDISREDCRYLYFGASQKILVYFFRTTNRALAEEQWEYINNMHSKEYFSTRCMVPGTRKTFVRCRDTNKCSECPYGRTPDTKQAPVVSWEGLLESGYEPEITESAEQLVMAKIEYLELRARMDAEDLRIARAFESKELLGDSVAKIAADLDISEPRIYQLIARAKVIGKEYQRDPYHK